jgi:hypothetical protein
MVYTKSLTNNRGVGYNLRSLDMARDLDYLGRNVRQIKISYRRCHSYSWCPDVLLDFDGTTILASLLF